jgi:serine/threonine kinase 16
MSSAEILSMFLQICEGVKAFHEAKPEPLSHRDLKTANILISGDRSPIIMDLGLYRVCVK